MVFVFAGQAAFEGPAGIASEDAGLGRVGVDDVGRQGAEQFFELEIGFQVVEEVNLAAEPVSEDDLKAAVLGHLEEGSFGADGRAGDQRHLMAAGRQQAAGNQRVFLRPAEDHPGYDVDDFHNSYCTCEFS